ncbi:MAG: ribonuclease P protein component [Chthoniobacterales bacterium]
MSSRTRRDGGLSFDRTKRLTKPAEFARVKSDGHSVAGSLLLLGVLQRSETPGFRAGFVTSKRVGGAVIRNRVRRRMREIVRKNQQRLRPGIWLVMVARPPAARSSYVELEHEWLRLANRASILAP